ncbi:hypothetical protein M2390_000955 [Mycetocola sp. BIGb0189]|uniref:hypothetical protein n=1 Tax=Mycetocola sp. BIGb0189 TaxID=2940604 RepID=UPI00216A01A4|nr:hypothetical protein [Mycetocola sp. BIGb0189]MCS4275783.1 hypothetical protein [Mycetocola sp. BIGb0189]
MTSNDPTQPQFDPPFAPPAQPTPPMPPYGGGYPPVPPGPTVPATAQGPGWFARHRNLILIIASACVILLVGGVSLLVGNVIGARSQREAVNQHIADQIQVFRDRAAGTLQDEDEDEDNGFDDGEDDDAGTGEDSAAGDSPYRDSPYSMFLKGVAPEDDTLTKVTKVSETVLSSVSTLCGGESCVQDVTETSPGVFAVTLSNQMNDSGVSTISTLLKSMNRVAMSSLLATGTADITSLTFATADGEQSATATSDSTAG